MTMTYRARNLVLALALAAAAAMLVMFYVGNYKKTVRQGVTQVPVLVAASDIPVGTPAAEATGMLRTNEVARRSVVPGAISDVGQIRGLTTVEPIYAGEQVTTRRFRSAREAGVRGELRGRERVLQLPGDANQLLYGTLEQGDRVDVLATLKYSPEDFGSGVGGERVASRVLLRDLLVARAPGADGGRALSVQLVVTDREAEKLFYVVRNGEWSLQLRPPRRAADSAPNVENVISVVGGELRGWRYEKLYRRGSKR